jgi:hypothetical protein
LQLINIIIIIIINVNRGTSIIGDVIISCDRLNV